MRWQRGLAGGKADPAPAVSTHLLPRWRPQHAAPQKGYVAFISAGGWRRYLCSPTADSHYSSFPTRTIPDIVRSVEHAGHGNQSSCTRLSSLTRIQSGDQPKHVNLALSSSISCFFNTQEISHNASQRSTPAAGPVLAARTRFCRLRMATEQQVLERSEQIPGATACGLYELVEVLGRLGKTPPVDRH